MIGLRARSDDHCRCRRVIRTGGGQQLRTMAAFFEGTSFRDTIEFMAGTGFAGGLVAGTVAVVIQVLDGGCFGCYTVSLMSLQWTAYGALFGRMDGLRCNPNRASR